MKQKVIGVHNSARIRMQRQKISETTFLTPLVPGGQSAGDQILSNDISENGEEYRGDDESPGSVDPSGLLVTPRRDTAPLAFRGPFSGHDSPANHRLHLSADTAYHPEHGYLETGTRVRGPRSLQDGQLESSEFNQAQVAHHHLLVQFLVIACRSQSMIILGNGNICSCI